MKGQPCGTQPIYVTTVTVDVEAPTVSVDAPNVNYYSVGIGGYIWLNLTVTDDIEALPNVVMNDTARFELLQVEHTAETGIYTFCYVNRIAIPDGPLAVWFSVTDYVGNWYDGPTIEGVGEVSALAETTVDNAAPIITIKVYAAGEELPKVDEMYYMGTDVTEIYIEYTILENELDSTPEYTYVYINTTEIYTGDAVGANNATQWPYDVTDIDYLVINVTVTDTASPYNHTATLMQEVLRGLVGPYEVGFTSVEPICGGLIVRGLYADDLVGVYDYQIYVNGTDLVATIPE